MTFTQLMQCSNIIESDVTTLAFFYSALSTSFRSCISK